MIRRCDSGSGSPAEYSGPSTSIDSTIKFRSRCLGSAAARLIVIVQKRDRDAPRPSSQVLAKLEVLELARRGGDIESLQFLAVDPDRHSNRVGPCLISAGPHADDVMRIPRKLMVHGDLALRREDKCSIIPG